jgi:hypothetical protein
LILQSEVDAYELEKNSAANQGLLDQIAMRGGYESNLATMQEQNQAVYDEYDRLYFAYSDAENAYWDAVN